MLNFRFVLCFQLCLTILSAGIAQPTKKKINKSSFTLSGKIEGVKNEKIYLSTNDADENVLDSTYAKDGKFSFKGKITEPTFYILKIADTRNQAALFVEPGNITLNANKDSLFKAIVKGSKSNDEWREWGKSWSRITAQAGPMYRRLDSATERGKVKASPEERKIFDDGMKSLNDQTAVAVMEFIKKHPQSSVAPFIIYDRYISFPDSAMEKKTFAMLGSQAKNSLYGKKITEYRRIAAKTGIGAMPDFTVTDTSGKLIKLSSLRGKYVLVDFWASWCAPCRKENPNVVKAYQKYHDKGFDIVGVSLDTKKDAWLKAIEKDSLTWNHVSDLKGWESGIVKEFGIKVVPTSFLLDRSGKVIANNLREEALPKKLEQLLK
jgi:peroxiredoxin